MHLLRNKPVKSDFFSFSLPQALLKGQWAVAYIRTTNYHKLILMQATAETAMGSGFRRNSVTELKLKNRCTGSTWITMGLQSTSGRYQWRIYIVKFWTLAPPLPRGPNSFNFIQFFGKIWQNHVLAPPGGLAPPPRGNPGSATGNASYWNAFL